MIIYVRNNYKFDSISPDEIVSDAFLALNKRFNTLPLLDFTSEKELKGYIYQTVRSFANKEYKKARLNYNLNPKDEDFVENEDQFEDEQTEYEFYGDTISHNYRSEFVYYMRIFYPHTDVKKFLENNIICTKLINYFCIDNFRYEEILKTNEFIGKTYTSIRQQYVRCLRRFKDFFSKQKRYNRL
jgi:hypothetical protein